MEERYIRNIPSLSEADMEALSRKHVIIAGCGGLGGYVLEYLARTGVGRITLADGDTFSVSNLNRQLLCTTRNIGARKAEEAVKRAELINPSLRTKAVCSFITPENAKSIIDGADLIIDALDSVRARLALEDAAEKAGITIIHGAVEGWNTEVMLVPPGSGLIHKLYYGRTGYNDMPDSVLPFTPALCAALEASAAVLFLTGKKTAIDKKMFSFSVKTFLSEAISF